MSADDADLSIRWQIDEDDCTYSKRWGSSISHSGLGYSIGIVLQDFRRSSEGPVWNCLELLVFKLALQLLGLGHLAHCAVEVVLADRLPLVLDSE